ncbi:acyltransferase family protein [Dactylosporangium cerinum]|uniref:Acyltransferase family protein n=1 Tax=Dactylosporangium cerinum TaxID=1434730 RepID=A0ABV9VQG2_9ACTN
MVTARVDDLDVPTDRKDAKVLARIPALTGLRWWAALGVFLYHAVTLPGIFAPSATMKPIQFILAPAGSLGVSFFFVLSGFVLTWSARPKDTAVSFWRRRAVRIYPNHWAGLLLAVGVMVLVSDYTQLHDVVRVVLLVQTWTPSFIVATGVNGVSWTLACEMFFYLCFPLLVLLIRRIAPARLYYWAAGIVAVVFLFPVLTSLLPAQPVMPYGPPVSEAASWFVERFPVTRMAEFALGIVLARIVLAGRWFRLPSWVAWAVLAAGYVVAMYNQGNLYGRIAITLIPVAVLVANAATSDVAGRPSLASRPTLVFLGNISFAFYIVHLTVLSNIGRLFPAARTTAIGFGIMVLALVVAFALAWLLHVAIEKPVYRRFATSRAERNAAPDVPSEDRDTRRTGTPVN